MGENKEVRKYYWSRAPGKIVNKLTGLERSFGTAPVEKLIKESVVEGIFPKKIIRVYEQVESASSLSPGPYFTGTVREWFETLLETIRDAANVLEKETGYFCGQLTCSIDIVNILEHLSDYRSNYELVNEPMRGKIADTKPRKVGSIKNIEIWLDSKCPSNLITLECVDEVGNVVGSFQVQVLDMPII